MRRGFGILPCCGVGMPVVITLIVHPASTSLRNARRTYLRLPIPPAGERLPACTLHSPPALSMHLFCCAPFGAPSFVLVVPLFAATTSLPQAITFPPVRYIPRLNFFVPPAFLRADKTNRDKPLSLIPVGNKDKVRKWCEPPDRREKWFFTTSNEWVLAQRLRPTSPQLGAKLFCS